MKLVMTLLVRDEEDIIKENIDFHYAQGVDFFIVTDNRSVDSTAQILKEYEKRGILHYIYEPDDNYAQSQWVTRMAKLAANEYKADWVINNDADEFWFPSGSNLKSLFASISDEFNVLKVKRSNFIPLELDGKIFYEKMIFKETQSLNSKGKPLLPKAAHRGNPDIIVRQGNHMVDNVKVEVINNMDIEILHFPIRDRSQFCNKIVKGGSAYERNTEIPEHIGATWRSLYKEFTADNNLDRFLNESIFENEAIKAGLSDGSITEDKRLFEYLITL